MCASCSFTGIISAWSKETYQLVWLKICYPSESLKCVNSCLTDICIGQRSLQLKCFWVAHYLSVCLFVNPNFNMPSVTYPNLENGQRGISTQHLFVSDNVTLIHYPARISHACAVSLAKLHKLAALTTLL